MSVRLCVGIVCMCVCACVCSMMWQSAYSSHHYCIYISTLCTLQEEWKLFYEEFAQSDSETAKVRDNLSSQWCIALILPLGTQIGVKDVDGRSGSTSDQQCSNTQSFRSTTLPKAPLTDQWGTGDITQSVEVSIASIYKWVVTVCSVVLSHQQWQVC